MSKKISILIFFLISLAPVYLVNSEEYINYDPVTNVCVLSPTGVDDTENLREAFSLVVAGGPGGEVYLEEGTFIISDKFIIVNFDGWFHGAGKDKTVIENKDTDTFPHYDLETFPDLSGVFLFYQTDDTVRTLKFSDMTIKFHGQTYDYNGFTGVNIIDVCGKVTSDLDDFYDTEIHTIIENMHFEGEELDTWHAYNVISSFQVEGQPVVTDTWYFKPVSGTHVARDCTFSKVGGGIGYRSLNGEATIENNVLEDVVFALINYDAGNKAKEGRAVWRNNKINRGILDAFWIEGAENNLFVDNEIDGMIAGNGIGLYNSKGCQVIGNHITNCGGAGISLSGSSYNTIYDNYLDENNVDIQWDGTGENYWIDNDYESTGEHSITETVSTKYTDLNDELTSTLAEKSDLMDDLNDANAEIETLESDVESMESELSELENELTTANSMINNLESQLASKISYSATGIIAVFAAIVFWFVGFYLGKKQ